MPILPAIQKGLNFIADALPWTPIGRGILAAREQSQMAQYRNQLMQRQQQEFDLADQQRKAAQAAFTPGTFAESIQVTPKVTDPNYAQARQQFDQTKVGTPSAVDYLPPAISSIAQGLAAAGQYGQAGQLLVNNAPQEKVTNFQAAQDPLGMGGAGQIDPQTGLIHNYTRPTTSAAAKDPMRAMTAEELKAAGFPEGTVAYLNTVTNEPTVKYRPDIRERTDLDQRTQQAGFFVLPSGEMVPGEFTPNRGVGYRDANGQLVPLPQGSRPGTPSMGGYLNPSQFLAKRNEFLQEQQALRRLNAYGQSVGNMETGLKNWASSVTAKFRTMLGSKELNPAEFARMTGEGQLQALLGLFRTDVVGPGVMTEFDAQRVLQALGGNIGMLQNPQVVERLLSDLYRDKMQRVQLLQREIARNSPVFGEEPMQISAPEEFTGTGAPSAPDQAGDVPEGIAPEVWREMTPEQKALWQR